MMFGFTMKSADPRLVDSFIEAAIVHRYWLTCENSRIASDSEVCGNNRRAISGALRELDEMILHSYLKSQNPSSLTN
jgi:hypothetical protein